MSEVTIRELRNHGGEVVERVTRGERLTITRSGKPVAELRPLRSQPKSLEAIITSRRHLPDVDPVALRDDIDKVIDPTL